MATVQITKQIKAGEQKTKKLGKPIQFTKILEKRI
jgi:hypothetical protein